MSPALSPSRANDFNQCPLLYRYRVIDKVPEPTSPALAKGTLVHEVLENIFDLTAPERTVETASVLLGKYWTAMKEKDKVYLELFADEDDPTTEERWLAEAQTLLENYWQMEDPQRFTPAEREQFLSVQLPDGPQLRGVVDRVDIAPTGQVRIVDYKTGKAPAPQYRAAAEFQMGFYALAVTLKTGRKPDMLRLVYLGNKQFIEQVPTQGHLEKTDHQIRSVWADISAAARDNNWRPKPSKLCGWCNFQAICPAFGGAELPIDPNKVEAATGVRPSV